ncbi:MAG: DIP1984 family protein [Oscillospiraceae bacterium]|nr:DIP1984 family protein [Oscillospiraceae bacterium]MDY6208477.1 DIP1984 family protein [Oscillospiraceae bacterium]
MRLAEALNLRADINKRISQLGERLRANAKVQEGDTPAENPEELLAELDRLTAELEELMGRINLTNSRTLSDGVSLTEMIAKKDALTLKSGIIRKFLAEASLKIERYSNKEIKILSTVNVAELRTHSDKLSEELRLLNVKIQKINWTTDLL